MVDSQASAEQHLNRSELIGGLELLADFNEANKLPSTHMRQAVEELRNHSDDPTVLIAHGGIKAANANVAAEGGELLDPGPIIMELNAAIAAARNLAAQGSQISTGAMEKAIARLSQLRPGDVVDMATVQEIGQYVNAARQEEQAVRGKEGEEFRETVGEFALGAATLVSAVRSPLGGLAAVGSAITGVMGDDKEAANKPNDKDQPAALWEKAAQFMIAMGLPKGVVVDLESVVSKTRALIYDVDPKQPVDVSPASLNYLIALVTPGQGQIQGQGRQGGGPIV